MQKSLVSGQWLDPAGIVSYYNQYLLVSTSKPCKRFWVISFHDDLVRGCDRGDWHTLINHWMPLLVLTSMFPHTMFMAERLFTMLDKTGDEQVNYREFIVGISPMITGNGTS